MIRRTFSGACIIVLFAPMSGLAQTGSDGVGFFKSLASDVRADFHYHYSSQALKKIVPGLGASAVLANTDADENIQRFFNDKVTGETGDDLSDLFTSIGDVAQPLYSMPIYLGAMWLGGYNSATESSLAHVTGGQRPDGGGLQVTVRF